MDKRWLHSYKWSSWKVLSGWTFLFLVLFKENSFGFYCTTWKRLGSFIANCVYDPNSFMAFIPYFTTIWNGCWYIHWRLQWVDSFDDWSSNDLLDQFNHGLLSIKWIWHIHNYHCMLAYSDKSHSLDILDLLTNSEVCRLEKISASYGQRNRSERLKFISIVK